MPILYALCEHGTNGYPGAVNELTRSKEKADLWRKANDTLHFVLVCSDNVKSLLINGQPCESRNKRTGTRCGLPETHSKDLRHHNGFESWD